MTIKEVKDSILEKLKHKIEEQKIESKAKQYFVWKNFLFIFLGALFTLLIFFCFSLLFFFISHNNFLFAGKFGPKIWQQLFLAFPWWLLILALVLIFILESILKKYQIIYRRPLIYSLGIFLMFTFIFGIIIARTSWHDELLEQARGRHLPILGGMYRNFDEPKDLYIGKLQAQTETVWTMQSRHGETQFVIVSSNTNFPQGDKFLVGDILFVVGPKNYDKIEAWAIMPFQPRAFDRSFGGPKAMMK